MAFPLEGTPIIQAFNPPPFGAGEGEVEAIGFVATGSGFALLTSVVGAPVVVIVDLDLADDEVAIGGPDSADVRRLFRGRDDGGGRNVQETVPILLGAQALAIAKAEDTAFVDADVGVPAYAVRRDADVAEGADGDYGPIHTDEDGRVKVDEIAAGAPVATAVSVDNTAGGTTLLAAAAAGVRSRQVIIRNVEDSAGESIFVGGVGVTAAAGMEVEQGAAVGVPGGSIAFESLGEVRAITAGAGPADVRVIAIEGT